MNEDEVFTFFVCFQRVKDGLILFAFVIKVSCADMVFCLAGFLWMLLHRFKGKFYC